MPPPVLSGQELYDQIMGTIEPELLSANLPNLSKQYADEPAEGRATRAKRYQAAFDEYDRRFARYCDQWNAQLHTYKRHAIQYIEHQARNGETQDMQSMESSLLQE